jgi:SnoaL-like domain
MPTLTDEEISRVEDACSRLVYQAAVHADAGDYPAFAGLFIPDGELVRPDGTSLRGSAAIVASYSQRSAHRQTRHVIARPLFSKVSSTECQATTLVTLWACDNRVAAGPRGRPVLQPLVLGEFEDIFHFGDSGWRISRRAARFLMHSPDFH